MAGTLLRLFLVCTKIGLFAFGGGNSAIPLLEAEAVPRWLSQGEYAELVGVNFALPGVSVLKVAGMVGYRVAGLSGLIVAAVGLAAPGLVLTVAAYGLLNRYRDTWFVQRALLAMQYAAAALLASSALHIWQTAAPGRAPMVGVLLTGALFAAAQFLKVPPATVMLLAVVVGVCLLG